MRRSNENFATDDRCCGGSITDACRPPRFAQKPSLYERTIINAFARPVYLHCKYMYMRSVRGVPKPNLLSENFVILLYLTKISGTECRAVENPGRRESPSQAIYRVQNTSSVGYSVFANTVLCVIVRLPLFYEGHTKV